MANCGRPCLLDEKKKSLILTLLRKGCSRVTAANSVRCHPKTILNTANRDPEFAEKLALAENASEFIHIENINNAGKEVKYWRASAWMLARLDPDRFGRSTPDAMTPSQITSLIVQIAEIILQEIPVVQYRQQIIKRLDCLLAEARLCKEPIPDSPQEASLIAEPAPAEQESDDSN